MVIRILVPTEGNEGMEAQVAQHFGRAPFFTVVKLQDNKVIDTETVPNTGEHFGGQGHPHENILSLKPDVIVAQGMGPGGLQSFRNSGIKVLQTNAGTIKDVVECFQKGELPELTAGCQHAHNHHHGQ
jgi:predicted Fe-Mo cluster-binding NifX family protein